MPEILPFQGWRYDLKRAGKAAKLVAPPYDVISPAQQEKLYRESPYNAIRIELTKDRPGSDKYQEAARTLSAWKKEGVLRLEDRPALYVYEQIYKEGGRSRTRVGFLAAMKVDESAVKKHEDTLAGPKEDRLKLLAATRTNLSPIWGLFEDAPGAVHRALRQSLKLKPSIDIVLAGVRHRLFVETRADVVSRIARAMKSKPMFIADGHHRFETASRFSREDGRPGAQYVMTYFSDVRNNPFTIYPTHRMLKMRPGQSLSETLAKIGTVKRCDQKRCLNPARIYQFGFYSKKDGFQILTLSPKVAARINRRSPVDRLDVAVLHQHIIAPHFGIEKIEKSPDIDFTRDPLEAVKKVKEGVWDVAIFLRPTSLDEMILASKKGLKMPQKSTYFYPKLLTGLVYRSLDD